MAIRIIEQSDVRQTGPKLDLVEYSEHSVVCILDFSVALSQEVDFSGVDSDTSFYDLNGDTVNFLTNRIMIPQFVVINNDSSLVMIDLDDISAANVGAEARFGAGFIPMTPFSVINFKKYDPLKKFVATQSGPSLGMLIIKADF